MCCRWFCPPLRSIPVWLNSPFPILTKQLSRILFHYFKLFKHWTSWSCILYAMVHRSVLQWTRWEGTVVAVHFSNEERLTERTFVAVLHFHFMTLHSTDAKVNFADKSTRFRSNVKPIETTRLFPLPIGQASRMPQEMVKFLTHGSECVSRAPRTEARAFVNHSL